MNTLSFECSLCLNVVSKDWLGSSCSTCNQRCCVSCELSCSKCPYCRSEHAWKIRPENLKHYVGEYYKKQNEKLQKFTNLQQVFVGLLQNDKRAISSFKKIDEDEDIADLLLISREYLYGVAQYSKDINDLESILGFMEILNENLDDPLLSPVIDLDEIEDLLFEQNYEILNRKHIPKPNLKYKPTKKHKGSLRKRMHYNYRQ